MAALLEMQHVTRRFGHRLALDDVTLALDAGRAVCLTGPNGAGKTTLLAVAAGVLASDAGCVLVGGRRLEDSDRLRRRIGYMADAPLVYDALSAVENLRFFADLYGLSSPARRIDQLLGLVGLTARAGEQVGAYSAGLRRRLDLARVLLHEPEILLLDEPANSLDAEGLEVLRAALQAQRTGERAVLLAARQASAAAGLADEILTIEHGRLVAGPAASPDARRASGAGAQHR
jgi:heme ABC exporter ATP-binding subunit CcmA